MSEARTDPDRPGFLLGALNAIVFDEVRRRVYDAYRSAGYADLTPAHSQVFIYLSPGGDRVVDLARRAGMSKQAMGYLVNSLEETGYVERVAHPADGRAKLVRRTEKGWQVNRLARQEVLRVQDEWAEQLGQDNMAILIRLLRQLVALIGILYRGSVSDLADGRPPDEGGSSDEI